MQAGPRKISAYVAAALGAFGAACCVTPVLPWLLGSLGVPGLLSLLYRDTVLLPFAGAMFLLALLLHKRAGA